MAEPQTVTQLIEWFEAHFQCFLGPARAYFEIELGQDFEYHGKGDAIYRGIYNTYAVKCADTEDAERKLVGVMHCDFLPLAMNKEGASLFWRLPEKILFEQKERQEYGPLVATKEIVEDYITRPPSAGIVVDESGCWYADAGKSQEYSLRTRLHMPALATVPYHMVTRKTEGSATLTI